MNNNDFPKELIDFEEMFATEKACRDHLFSRKYPDGFICSKCGCSDFWWTKKQLMHCKNCGQQDSLRKNTVMESSKKPLLKWYRAIYLITVQKTGISAKSIQNLLGFKSYQTAWSWCHKIRKSMVRSDRTKLENKVVVDEAFIGGTQTGKRGRGSENKTLIAVAVEQKEPRKIGRIRIDVINDSSFPTLSKFLKQNAAPGSMIKTDEWKGYKPLENTKFDHESYPAKDKEKSPFYSVNLVISLLKRLQLGAHQGRISPKHLKNYLEEFVFRFNRRKSANRGKLFYRLLDQCIVTKSTPYWKIIGRIDPMKPLEKAA
jgi:transposase-like protein